MDHTELLNLIKATEDSGRKLRLVTVQSFRS